MIQHSEKDIEKAIVKAVELVLKHDIFLLENAANERSVAHKLAEYLTPLFPEYHVDCEYNRHGIDVKEIERSRRIYPDIVIHRRNTDDNNLLVVEVKTNQSTDDNDILKLERLTAADGAFHYFLGAAIDLKDFRNHEVRWYQKGIKIQID